MAKAKDPLKMVPMRLPASLVKRLDTATAAFGKRTSRTAVTIRLINDGFKWWAREDLEQDTTLQMVAQMHERSATILAMQNVMAQRLGLMDGEAQAAKFTADVQAMKARILKLTGGVKSDGSVSDGGGGGRVGAAGDDDGDDLGDPGNGDDDEDDRGGGHGVPD